MASEIHHCYMYMSYYDLYVNSETNLALRKAPGLSVSLSGTVSLTGPWLYVEIVSNLLSAMPLRSPQIFL